MNDPNTQVRPTNSKIRSPERSKEGQSTISLLLSSMIFSKPKHMNILASLISLWEISQISSPTLSQHKKTSMMLIFTVFLMRLMVNPTPRSSQLSSIPRGFWSCEIDPRSDLILRSGQKSTQPSSHSSNDSSMIPINSSCVRSSILTI